jgi:nicotinamide-nucleotide amidase
MKKEQRSQQREASDVAARIGDFLMQRNESIAVAESVTAGLVQNTLGSVENASRFFQGGLTAYNIGQKARHLSIEPIHAIACNCVSERIATQMATNVCEMFRCDWGLSVTGYAAPVPESGNKLFAFISVAYRGKIMYVGKTLSQKKMPDVVQQEYVRALLNKAYEKMQTLRKKQRT